MLGKMGRDKVTGFAGVIIARVEYLFGCNQYGIAPKVDKDGNVKSAEFFDEGRIEITGEGISPESVQVEKKGGISRDVPNGTR